LSRAVSGDRNKIKTLHDMKTAANRGPTAASLAQENFSTKRQNQPFLF
jgi:hypothetical protein